MKAGKTRADWTEAEIRDAGAVARKEIDRRVDVSDLDAQKIRLARDVDHLERDLVRINDSDAALYARYKRDEIDFLDYRDEARKINDARTQVQRELIAKRREIQAVQALSTERRVQTTREVLGEIRPYGGGREVQFQKVKSGNTQTLPSKKKAIAADEMNAVRMNYPDEWWDEMADSLEDRRFSVGFNDRGYFSEGRREIRISDRAASWSKTTDERVISGLRNVATHEAGHAMEYTIPDIVRLEGDFWRRRTAGQSMERLSRIFPNHGYRSDERAILDDFIHAYIGKDYHGRYYEVLSMGNDSLLGDPLLNDRNEEMWGKDTDMIDFILGLLAAL